MFDLNQFLNSPFIWPFIIWSLIWKGLALWKAAQRGEKPWFIVMLIVNTIGILEILYIYIFSKKENSNTIPA